MNKLKTIMIIFIMMLSKFAFSQMHIDSLYDNKDKLLIYSVVKDFDSLPQEFINNEVKNWASTNFVNMKEVLISETKDQLVFLYITKSSFYITTFGSKDYCSWYIRMIVQTKDNKIKISLYDDGNAYWPGSYNSGGYSKPSTEERKYNLSTYFFGKKNCIKPYNNGLKNFRSDCILTCSSLINKIKSNEIEKDW